MKSLKLLKTIFYDTIIILMIPILLQIFTYLNFPQLLIFEYNFIDELKSKIRVTITNYIIITLILYLIIIIFFNHYKLFFLPIIFFIFSVIFFLCHLINFRDLNIFGVGSFMLDFLFDEIYKFPLYYSISLIPSSLILYLVRKKSEK
jgi:hypothetical protein